jgi:ribosomal protein S18 acetylase RimI-like enzyme
MTAFIHEMTMDDYDEVYRLWQESEGVRLGESDTRAAIEVYLRRNGGFCFVAAVDGCIKGAVLCGHDGRRGTMRHLAVQKAQRGRGIGRALVDRCLSALSREGITRCNIFVLSGNTEGSRFWEHLGWRGLEDDFRVMQMRTA